MQKIWFVLKLTAKWAYDLRSLVLSMMALAGDNYNPFLYFRF